MKHYSDSPLSFRAKPDGPLISLSKPQHRKLARYLAEQRQHCRDVFALQILMETGIEQYQGRMSEMRVLGFDIETKPQLNPEKRDRRKIFRLADNIELIERSGNDEA